MFGRSIAVPMLLFNFLESQFISVLYGQLRGKIGLSEQEISDLADYFRVQDGRVFYAQLCEVIHNSGKEISSS